MNRMHGGKKATVVAILMAVLLVPALASAYDCGNRRGKGGMGERGERMERMGRMGRGGSPTGIWRNPAAIEDLKLSDEQVKAIRDADALNLDKKQVVLDFFFALRAA